jgi:WD40 repeat protein
VGSHDNYIDLYSVKRGYEHSKRLKGHTSYVTHLDWSKDSRVIMSNCGAYEIIWWDARAGAMLRSTRDSVEANTDWATWTCVLGFPVMGIWPKESDGTDVNSVDRSRDGRVVVTGDDFGKVKLFACPVVVEHAPYREATGHSSHVMNVRFTADQRSVVSVGGHDMSVFQWRFVQTDARAGASMPPQRRSHA